MPTRIFRIKEPQTTIAEPTKITGLMPHNWLPTEAVLLPADADQGINFIASGHPIHLNALNTLTDAQLVDISLSDGQGQARGIRHLCAALLGLGIDNATIELRDGIVPLSEYSCSLFCRAITKAGRQTLQADKMCMSIQTNGRVSGVNDSFVEYMPSAALSAEIVDDLPKPLGLQCTSYCQGISDFCDEFSWARDFLHYPLPPNDFRLPLIKDRPKNTTPLILSTGQKILTPLRSNDEPARHELVDLLGTLACLGVAPLGRFVVFRPNPNLLKKLLSALSTSVR